MTTSTRGNDVEAGGPCGCRQFRLVVDGIVSISVQGVLDVVLIGLSGL